MPSTKIAISGDAELDEKISLWLKWDRNNKTRNEIQEMIKEANWKSLRARLMNRLEFGTAGLRACMRAGFDSMNDVVVIQTAQGLCEYIKQKFPDPIKWKERGVVFGYDGRHNSKRFAELSACVFTERGINVWLYGQMVATPFVPFGITKKKCLAGVMVTASHNPKEDNGYKVYWENGAQIITPHDKGIQNSILEWLEPSNNSWSTEKLHNNPQLADPYEEVFDWYYKKLLLSIPEKFLDINNVSDIHFVYTAMHGVGYPFVKEAFRAAKLKFLVAVEEQKDPDPEFSTVKFPNPEEGKSCLKLSMRKADAVDSNIILANDPDADRLACAERDIGSGVWKVFNGNELGALLGWWAIHTYKELNSNVTDLSHCYLLASTVSSKILRAIAAVEGCNFVETLTGFKWMGNIATDLISTNKTVLFAFEEAIGFMFSDNVLDKDGVSAACHLATMACYLRSQHGLSLNEKLNEIYKKYGFHCTNCAYLFCYEPKTVKAIFDRLRMFDNGKPNTYPRCVLGGEFCIKSIRDLTTGIDTSEPDGKAKLPVSSSTQMITFTFENDFIITLRTSGTEPKIKYYAELCAKPEERNWGDLRTVVKRITQAVVDEFLQPKRNNLILKSD